MLEGLQAGIKECLTRDQYRLRQKLQRLQRQNRSSTDGWRRAAGQLKAEVARSRAQAADRLSRLPDVSVPKLLPIADRRDDIAAALNENQVLVLAGETGSGKTTQIPKICLRAGYGARGLIGHTQPRRLAASSVAARIADEIREETGQAPGKGVGYQVRFSDNTDESTYLKLMTDGILLAEIQQDRFLNKYEVIIIDEAHERSLNIDFLLGYLKRLLSRRPNLKLIITSATIDVEKFSRHFDNAPIISVSGRSFPVEIAYRPPEELEDSTEGNDDTLTRSVLSVLREIDADEKRTRASRGDVLVFLSGEKDIRDLAQQLRKQQLRDTEVLPLYARLSHSEQRRIFSSHRGRRIILSTNVAETSLTVPGIVYVIDTGLARISRYSVQSKVQRLPVEPISQASANQRAGRCGRITSGVCFRLYSEEDFDSRPQFTDPEIRRTNLSAVILQMLLLRLGNIEDFPFVEQPEQKAINDGFRLLAELGAIDGDRKLTATGRKMAALPTDPRLARMVLEADNRHCLHEVLIVVSALSIQDPRDFPPDRKQAAAEKHSKFKHPQSDFMSFISLWCEFELQRQELTQNKLRQYCRENFLSFMRMREWRETHRQLALACKQSGLRNPPAAKAQSSGESSGEGNAGTDPEEHYEGIHRAIIRGSLNQIGLKTEERLYLGSRNRKFALFPSSSLAKRPPKWVVTAELIETSRLYATLAASIRPEWVVEAAGDLVKLEHFEPHWEKKRSQVVAFEKVMLFGLVLIEKRRVDFARIEPEQSREIFIRQALVEGQFETRAGFYRHNRELITSLRRQEEKQRRPDILVNEEQIADFYEQRIPACVCDGKSFHRWLRKLSPEAEHGLKMTADDLLQRSLDSDADSSFPDQTEIHRNRLDIDYRFEPGMADDGATIAVPLALLAQISRPDLDWAVPGQLRERSIAMIKGLPKSLRKNFIPVADFVDEVLSAANTDEGDQARRLSLAEYLVRQAKRRKQVDLSRDMLESVELPPHLLPRVRLLDEKGCEVAVGSDLQALQKRFAPTGSCDPAGGPAGQRDQAGLHPLEKTGLTEWNFGRLPGEVEVGETVRLLRYPALVDRGDSVNIVLFEDAAGARRASADGLIRLYMLRTTQQKNLVYKAMRSLEKQVALKLPGGITQLPENALRQIYAEAFNVESVLPGDAGEFEKALYNGRSRLLDTSEDYEKVLRKIFDAHFQLTRQVRRIKASDQLYAREDMLEQLGHLINVDFPAGISWQWLGEYPRYFKAMEYRLDKLPQQLNRDRENTALVAEFWHKYRARYMGRQEEGGSGADDETNRFRWLIEELRVSLFAQPLKTKVPVSGKRLQKKWAEIVQQA